MRSDFAIFIPTHKRPDTQYTLDLLRNCGYTGEIKINDNLEWECPECGNKDKNKMNVTRRTCGYLGENFWNVGKTKEIKSRVTHL